MTPDVFRPTLGELHPVESLMALIRSADGSQSNEETIMRMRNAFTLFGNPWWVLWGHPVLRRMP